MTGEISDGRGWTVVWSCGKQNSWGCGSQACRQVIHPFWFVWPVSTCQMSSGVEGRAQQRIQRWPVKGSWSQGGVQFHWQVSYSSVLALKSFMTLHCSFLLETNLLSDHLCWAFKLYVESIICFLLHHQIYHLSLL